MLGLNNTSRWSLLVLAAAALVGCSESDDPEGQPGDFVSDNPYGGDQDGSHEGETAGTADPGGDDGSGDDEGGSRDVAEADIVHVQDDRLYALSPYGGLTVIDVSTPDTLPVLGRFRANAEPFEMYVDGTDLFIMYQGWGEYVESENGGYTWQSTSRLVSLDASDPSNVTVTGDFEMPGYLSDSRRVGDVLYVVTKEDEWCWSCDSSNNATVVTSIDIQDRTDIELVDQLRLPDAQGWGGQRSVSANDQRLYIAGPDWDVGPDDNSTIEVVDISDPSGALVQGARIPIAGRILSRWQMDEHDGVLRVVSQPGWSGAEPPRVETFTVASASDVSPLGSLQMTLPRPETLQSVRFDALKAYAITFEQTDPLFTLDLSDPSAPQQVGELEIPGFVYHMETRGDRVLGIGFDRGNDEGSLNASLFDVSDFGAPSMIERVHFGGDWGSFAEDQDRLHKSFQVLDDQGLLLVPFSGWTFEDDAPQWGGCGTYNSGIQLVDWADDTLALRGVAPMQGSARRGLFHAQRLLGVSEQSVEVFDVTDRDAPARTSALALSSRADRIAPGGDVFVRLAQDWWTDETRLEVVDGHAPQTAEALGSLSLDALAPEPPEGPEAAEWGCVRYGYFDTEMFVHEGFVYLVHNTTLWDGSDGDTSIDVVDITDPTAPTYVDTLVVPGTSGYSYGTHLSNDERSILRVGDTLVLAMAHTQWETESDVGTSTGTFQVVDLSTPGAPVVAQTIERPAGLAHGGLQEFDGVAVSWHMQDAGAGKVRYYLDRLDLPSAADAQPRTPVNVPGTVVAWDESSQRAVVADFLLESTPDESECDTAPNAWWTESGCALVHRPLHLVQVSGTGASLLHTADIEGDDAALRGVVATEDRLFAHVQRGGYDWVEDDSGSYETLPEAEVVVFADWTGSDLAPEGLLTLANGHSWLGSLTAVGTKLVFRANNGLGIIDASNAAEPVMNIHNLWGSYCGDLQTDETTAYCAMGPWGVQAVELD
jgi:hypothetical protein